MPETSASGTPPDGRTVDEASIEYPPERSGWIGWIVFAAMMLVLGGLFELVAGFVAIVDEDYFQATGAAPLFLAVSQQTWGVLQLVVGAAAILIAAGMLRGNVVARAFGAGIALISALSNLLAIDAYPLWSVVMITLDVVILYAITRHGEEMRPVA